MEMGECYIPTEYMGLYLKLKRVFTDPEALEEVVIEYLRMVVKSCPPD